MFTSLGVWVTVDICCRQHLHHLVMIHHYFHFRCCCRPSLVTNEELLSWSVSERYHHDHLHQCLSEKESTKGMKSRKDRRWVWWSIPDNSFFIVLYFGMVMYPWYYFISFSYGETSLKLKVKFFIFLSVKFS